MKQKEKKRRVHYLVNKKFQLKYAITALVIMLLVSIVFALTGYQLGWIPLVEKLSAVYPQGMLVPILKTVTLKLIIRFLLLSPIIIIACIYLSHKIAGPLVRIESEMNNIANGNLRIRVKLRKGDELQRLICPINRLIERIDQMFGKNKTLIEDSLAALKNLKGKLEQDKSPEIINLVNQLEKLLGDINKSYDDFQISKA